MRQWRSWWAVSAVGVALALFRPPALWAPLAMAAPKDAAAARMQKHRRPARVRQRQSIDSFCEGLADLTQDRARRRLFALWLGDRARPGQARWVEYADPEKLEWALKNQQVAQVAELWMRDDGAATVAVTLAGEARDWSAFVDYCFRRDGSLARIEATGEGAASTRYFLAAGAALTTSRARHPVYSTLSDLPFALLLPIAAQAVAE
jgi:hypothetical protein